MPVFDELEFELVVKMARFFDLKFIATDENIVGLAIDASAPPFFSLILAVLLLINFRALQSAHAPMDTFDVHVLKSVR